MTELNQKIWEDIHRLHHNYEDIDLANDAHSIFLLARDCARFMASYHMAPLATKLANAELSYYIDVWTAQHPDASL